MKAIKNIALPERHRRRRARPGGPAFRAQAVARLIVEAARPQ